MRTGGMRARERYRTVARQPLRAVEADACSESRPAFEALTNGLGWAASAHRGTAGSRARCALLAYIHLCRLSAVLQGSSVVGSTQAQDLLAEAEELRAAGESKRSKAGY